MEQAKIHFAQWASVLVRQYKYLSKKLNSICLLAYNPAMHISFILFSTTIMMGSTKTES